MKRVVSGLTLAVAAALLVASCTPNKDMPLSSSAAQKEKEPAASEPLVAPQGYQMAETKSFRFAVPQDWQITAGESQEALIFHKDGVQVGETEVSDWLDAKTWRSLMPNHTDKKDFREITDFVALKDVDARLYSVELIHTKPAAQNDPNWSLRETRWYIAMKERGISYGFYFEKGRVDEAVVKTILGSFRVKE
ncbi:hypothetical protein WMW72_06940 [Paenibacillus filicis]|uniref:Lipoprotein n=1 Tax=Paenibacillus filicis TaxID=669464 RepID=A0ABU9DHA7_9BACL